MNSLTNKNDQHNTRRPKWYPLLEQARAYHAMGFNVLPVRGKRPARDPKTRKPYEWQRWQTERQTVIDVNRMPWRNATGIAAICGAVSGGLVCMDFDKQPDRRNVVRFLQAAGLPSDYPWLVNTPGGGFHVWLLCPDLDLPGNVGKLDRTSEPGGHVELRYTGHYALLPPSKHPSGGRYTCKHPLNAAPQAVTP